jgi:hypothetical protein
MLSTVLFVPIYSSLGLIFTHSTTVIAAIAHCSEIESYSLLYLGTDTNFKRSFLNTSKN